MFWASTTRVGQEKPNWILQTNPSAKTSKVMDAQTWFYENVVIENAH